MIFDGLVFYFDDVRFSYNDAKELKKGITDNGGQVSYATNKRVSAMSHFVDFVLHECYSC